MLLRRSQGLLMRRGLSQMSRGLPMRRGMLQRGRIANATGVVTVEPGVNAKMSGLVAEEPRFANKLGGVCWQRCWGLMSRAGCC